MCARAGLVQCDGSQLWNGGAGACQVKYIAVGVASVLSFPREKVKLITAITSPAFRLKAKMLFLPVLSILGAVCSVQAVSIKYKCPPRQKINIPDEFQVCIQACQVRMAKAQDCTGRVYVSRSGLNEDWGDIHVKMQFTGKGLGQYYKSADILRGCEKLCSGCYAPMSFVFDTGLTVSFNYIHNGGERRGFANGTFLGSNSTDESIAGTTVAEESFTDSNSTDAELQDPSVSSLATDSSPIRRHHQARYTDLPQLLQVTRRSYPISLEKRVSCHGVAKTIFYGGGAALARLYLQTVREQLWHVADGGIFDPGLLRSIADEIFTRRFSGLPVVVGFTRVFGNARAGQYSIVMLPAVNDWQEVVDAVGGTANIIHTLSLAIEAFEASGGTTAALELFAFVNGTPVDDLLASILITRTAT